jgi:hypothetical protein
MTPDQRQVEINMSGIPVAGIGGLGLVAIAVLMTVVLPEAWWLLVMGVVGGVVLGALMVVVRRHYRTSGPSGDDPTILFRPEPLTTSDQEADLTAIRPWDSERRVVVFPSGRVTTLLVPVRDRS